MADEFKPTSKAEAVEKILDALLSSKDKEIELVRANIIRDNILEGNLTPKTGVKEQ